MDLGGDRVADGGEVGGFNDDDNVVTASDDIDGLYVGGLAECAYHFFGFANRGFNEYECPSRCHVMSFVVAELLVRLYFTPMIPQ